MGHDDVKTLAFYYNFCLFMRKQIAYDQINK